MSRVAMLIPSRDRAVAFKTALDSVKKTAPNVRVFGYIDEDSGNVTSYPIDKFTCVVGPRVGVSKSLNKLSEYIFENHPEIDTLAMMTDDSVLLVPGWDEYAAAELDAMPKRIGVVSPLSHGEGAHRVDQPCLSKEWIKFWGCFAHTGTDHYAWPSVIGITAEGICLTKAPADKFAMRHDQMGNLTTTFDRDSRTFYEWAAWHMDEHRFQLRKEIA